MIGANRPAIVVTSGHHSAANYGAVAADRHDLILSYALVSASMFDERNCRHRLHR